MEKTKKQRLHFGDVVAKIAERHPNMTKGQIGTTLSEFFKLVPELVYSGNDISIRRFGVFGLRHAKARKARNPKAKTGEGNVVDVPEKEVFRFWPNAKMKSNLAYEAFMASGEAESEPDSEKDE